MAQWYYQVMDEILGPTSLDNLKEKVEDGEIDDKSLVRQGSGGEWVMVSDIKELKLSVAQPLSDFQAEEIEDSLPGTPADTASPEAGSPDTAAESEVVYEPVGSESSSVRRSPLSLRPCSDCGTMVSKQASVCPKCGRSFHESTVEVRYKGEHPVPVLAFFTILAIPFVALSPMVVYFVTESIAGKFTNDGPTCMTIGLTLAILQLVLMITCSLMGGAVGKPRMAYVTGLFLGLFFGPLGVFAASAIDKRPRCRQCCSRLSGLPRECPSCHSRLIWKVETSWY